LSITVERIGAQPAWVPASQYPFQYRSLPVDGGRMHYIDEGEGEPIVFLHGTPTWSFIFRHLIRGLHREYRCIAPDMIGFGLSEKPPHWSYSPLDQARNLGMLVDHLSLDKFTLVMHDYGAAVGTTYAVDHPDRIKRMVVMNGACWSMHDDPHAHRIARIASGVGGRMLLTNFTNWAKIVRRTFGDRSKFTETFEKAIAGPTLNKEDRIGIWLTAKALGTSASFLDDVWKRRKQMADLPFQFIWGMRDPLYGEKCLNKWWQGFPLCPVERLASAGHFPMEEKPADVLEAVREFMRAPINVSYLG